MSRDEHLQAPLPRQQTLRCELELRLSDKDKGDFPYAEAILTNDSSDILTIDWQCHEFDYLEVVFYDKADKKITSFPRYGTVFWWPGPTGGGRTVLQPGQSFRGPVSLRGSFGEDRKYAGPVFIKLVYVYKELQAESPRVQCTLK